MSESRIFDKLKQLIIEVNPICDASSITAEANFEDDLLFDDLDMLELQGAVEDELEISIDDDAWIDCRTVQDIINLVGESPTTH